MNDPKTIAEGLREAELDAIHAAARPVSWWPTVAMLLMLWAVDFLFGRGPAIGFACGTLIGVLFLMYEHGRNIQIKEKAVERYLRSHLQGDAE